MHTSTLTARLLHSCLVLTALVASMLSSGYASATAAPATSCLNNYFADGHMVLHFDTEQQADHIVLETLNAPSGTVVRISDGTRSIDMVLGEADENRTDVLLRNPLSGTDFTLSTASAAMGDEAVCITAVTLTLGQAHVVADAKSPSLLLDSAPVPTLVGTWHTTVCSSVQRSLAFLADGTWHLQTTDIERQGSWQMRDGQLQMRLGQAGVFVDMHMLAQNVGHDAATSDDGVAHHTVLMLRGALAAELDATFTDAAVY